MFNGSETIHRGEGWKSITDQYSNKGPIIIVSDSDDKELFRILYDIVTRRLRLIIKATGEKVEARLPQTMVIK